MTRAPALYLVTDRAVSATPLPELVAAALSRVDGRRVAVQLREKDLGGRELLALALALRPVCRARGARLLVNDRLDVALAAGADGVHLPVSAFSAADARALLGPGAWVGVSCHSAAEVRARAPGADFATFGPVYATASKAKYGPPAGLAELPDAKSVGLPLVALGGVDSANARALAEAGFAGVACIKAVFSAQDPAGAAHALLRAFDRS